jgi:hypothetical protein
MGREIHKCECAVCQINEDTVRVAEHRQINVLLRKLNEVQRRWYIGSLSQQRGGPSDRELVKISGMDAKTIRRGRRELRDGTAEQLGTRQRPPGGGRPKSEKKTAD